MKKQKNLRLRTDLESEFRRISDILGLKQEEALEMALSDWTKQHSREAQKKLDLYAERGVVINNPSEVNITVFAKAEVLVAKEELNRLISNVEKGNPEYKREMQLELAQALRKIQPVYSRTKDPELLSILINAEKHIGV